LGRAPFAVEPERRFQRGEQHPVGPQRPAQRMLAALFDQLGTAEQDSGLRPAEELVAADQDQVGPIAQTLYSRGLAEGRVEGATAEVVYQVYTSYTCEPRELRHRRHLGEPEQREVRP